MRICNHSQLVIFQWYFCQHAPKLFSAFLVTIIISNDYHFILFQVQVAEGPGGEIRVRDLSLHLAATEEVAQSLLFQGSTCRKVAETSMNQCSSRSHTIFSIVLTAKTGNSEVITRYVIILTISLQACKESRALRDVTATLLSYVC